jgi:glycerate-2-kinase
VSLEDFQRTTRLLLNAGADIYQLNAVRSQISRVKGGRLRESIAGRLVNLILSDVLGNDVSVIASGPTVSPRSTTQDALAVINRLGLLDQLPDSVRNALVSPIGQGRNGRSDDVTVIVADNELAIGAAGKTLHDAGLLIERSPIPGTGEAADRARGFVQWLNSLPSTVTAAIGGGEYTVHVTGNGLGGRNTEFALAAALELDRLGSTDWTVASLASDGDDAMTQVAGAIVDGASIRAMRELGHDPDASLWNNDSLAPLAAIGATHVTGPTGTNVNDLYLAVRLSKV